jgi:hypothetical protein
MFKNSNSTRIEGNNLYNESKKATSNEAKRTCLQSACQLYQKAIFCANNNEERASAHKNNLMASSGLLEYYY